MTSEKSVHIYKVRERTVRFARAEQL